jgi:hypothetical protein
MNYEPNTTTWKLDDLVIHDADAKNVNMLMRVIGYTTDGQCRTVYVDDTRRRGNVFVNDIKYLHDPARFGIEQRPPVHGESGRTAPGETP